MPTQSQTLQFETTSLNVSENVSQATVNPSYERAVQVPETAPSSTILLVLTFGVWLLRQRIA
ncbi:MAG: hypothetical protein R6U67_01870 [Sodalinema sp.]|uniref:hypothetical protein n=1 Tax=Sodalinema sp. TaxID=3080550 RepID=UPI001221FCFF|nr:MAG: hypothetical protein EYR95_00835 [Phormidium sp. SL48-SHIP]